MKRGGAPRARLPPRRSAVRRRPGPSSRDAAEAQRHGPWVATALNLARTEHIAPHALRVDRAETDAHLCRVHIHPYVGGIVPGPDR